MMKMKKSILCVVLCLLLLLPATAFAAGDNLQAAEQILQNAQKTSFAVLFTGDINGQEGKTDTAIGYPLMKALVEDSVTEYEAMLLDCGNALKGDGGKTIKEMDAAGYIAASVGTRDAALGIERLQTLSAMADFPLLCANWLKDDGDLLFDPYVVVEMAGIRVGVIGLISPSIKDTYPEITQNCNVYDPGAIANIYYDEMQAAGCSYYIALTSLGYDGEYTPRDLGAKSPWLNLILDSNTTTPLDHGELVEKTNVIVYNLAPDFTQAGSLIVQMGGADGNINTAPSTLTLGDLSSLTGNKDVQKVIDTEYVEELPQESEQPTDEAQKDAAGEAQTTSDGKVSYQISGTAIFLIGLCAIALITIVVVAVLTRKKKKDPQ